MSNPVEDFIISLGFDTSKVKSQIQTLHKELEKLAVNVDAKRVKQALTTQKTIGNNEVKVAKETAKAKEKVETAADKKRIAAEKQVQKTITETRKQAALRQLRNQIAEYERSTTGPSNLSNRYKYYERGNASMTKIRAFTEEIRGKNTDTRNRMKAEGSLKSFDSAASSKAEMDMMKASNALEVLRTRMSKMGMQTTNLDKQLVDSKDLNSLKRLIEQTKHQINIEKELNKGRVKAAVVTKDADAHVLAFQKQQARLAKKQSAEAERELRRQQKLAALKPEKTGVANMLNAYKSKGLMSRDRTFDEAIIAGAMKQSTQKQAEAYIKSSMRAAEYSNKGVGNKRQTMQIISEGNVQVLSKANMQLASMNAKMAAVERRAIGTAAAFGGMHDSARNMVREMASVYAVMAATGAIKEQAKAMDGMQAGMVAVSSNAEEAAHNIKFLTDEALKNGLSIKDASKDYVKLKASIGDKLGLAETEEMFQALTKAGVVFQLSQDDMSGTIRAVSQINNYRSAA